MELEHIKKLKQVLADLQSQDDSKLSELQKQKIKEATDVLGQAEQESKKKKITWNTILTLGLQAASLLVEMLKSG